MLVHQQYTHTHNTVFYDSEPIAKCPTVFQCYLSNKIIVKHPGFRLLNDAYHLNLNLNQHKVQNY